MNSPRVAASLLLVLAASLPASEPVAIGGFTVAVLSEPLRLEIAAGGRTLVAEKAAVPLLRFGRATERVKSNLGSYHFSEDIEETVVAWKETLRNLGQGALELTVELRPVPPARKPARGSATVRIEAAGDGALRVTAAADGAQYNRVFFAFPSPADEEFLGFGEQYNRVRHAGQRVPVWVSEQGIGRGDGIVRFPFTGRTTDSYFPMPYFLSTRGYGFLLDTTARSVFDLRVPPRQDRVSVEAWSGSAGFHLFAGPAPADVVRQLAGVTGKPRMLPDWGFGVWVACQGGPARIRQLLDRLQAAGLKPDAIWAQDWLGAREKFYGYDVLYHWTADERLYPNLKEFIAELHGKGIRFLGYFNTFIEQEFPEFAEAASKGFLVRKADGSPYVQLISTFKGGLLDLSNPQAREYMAGFLRRALQLGMDGWMADFGEWLPWDAKIAAPEGAPLWHNRYPVEWARLNREAALAERPDGDFVIFNRSGYTGSVPWLDILWAGDQNTSWRKDDGLPSVVPAGINAGLSGIPLYHFDAGGFTSLVSLPRGEELFLRWVEAGAMSPLMRTHEGYWRQRNVQVDSNERVLKHFVAMAKLHRAIQPRLLAAAREAVATGLPVMRHLWLAYPQDAAAIDIRDQYLLGADLMAAPVLEPNKKSRRVYFPAGSTWKHWWSGQVHSGPAWAEVTAPIGQPALFTRQ